MKQLKNARFKFKVDHREENELDVIENTMAKVREFKIQDMKAALAQVWGMEEGKNPFKKEEEEKEKPVITKGGKTLTGKKPAAIDVNPKIKV
jgi:replication initiation and membrane attachment protein DnaB